MVVAYLEVNTQRLGGPVFLMTLTDRGLEHEQNTRLIQTSQNCACKSKEIQKYKNLYQNDSDSSSKQADSSDWSLEYVFTSLLFVVHRWDKGYRNTIINNNSIYRSFMRPIDENIPVIWS